jgi:hypothetical protein
MTCITSGGGYAYPFGAHEFTSTFSGVHAVWSLVFYIYIYIYTYFVIQRSVKFFITMYCVLGVVLQTILDVYNCSTCIVSLYRNDPTPRKIDRSGP